MSIELIDVNDKASRYKAIVLLWHSLKERTPDQSISHTKMPTIQQHRDFVLAKPYPHWYLIRIAGTSTAVGNVYMTDHREVGIHIDNAHRGMGYGSAALKALREICPGHLLANINPANSASIEFFKKHGATLLQHTYKL